MLRREPYCFTCLLDNDHRLVILIGLNLKSQILYIILSGLIRKLGPDQSPHSIDSVFNICY